MKKIVRALVVAFLPLTLCAGPPPAAADEPSPLLVRWALLIGGMTQGGPPGHGLDDEDAEKLLFDWEFEWDHERDNAELKSIFGLERIDTLNRGTSRLGVDGGAVSSVSQLDDSEIRVEMRVEPLVAETSEPAAMARFEIYRDDRPLSFPTIVTRYGERVIVTSTTPGDVAGDGEPPLLWLVLQVDRLNDPPSR